MDYIVLRYLEWKKKHPDEDYQCDEILEFVNSLGRGEIFTVFEYLAKHYEGN